MMSSDSGWQHLSWPGWSLCGVEFQDCGGPDGPGLRGPSKSVVGGRHDELTSWLFAQTVWIEGCCAAELVGWSRFQASKARVSSFPCCVSTPIINTDLCSFVVQQESLQSFLFCVAVLQCFGPNVGPDLCKRKTWAVFLLHFFNPGCLLHQGLHYPVTQFSRAIWKLSLWESWLTNQDGSGDKLRHRMNLVPRSRCKHSFHLNIIKEPFVLVTMMIMMMITGSFSL